MHPNPFRRSQQHGWRAKTALLSIAVVLTACGGGVPESERTHANVEGADAPLTRALAAEAAADASPAASSPGLRAPAAHYSLPDGTLVTRIGGRVRDRHAREQPDAPDADLYSLFAPHYFERRTHEMTIYENVSPANPQNRILTLVVKPQWWWYGTNFRHGFIGRRDGDPFGPAAVALYGDNGGMKRLPVGHLLAGQELKTPLSNYDSLPYDPGANYGVDLAVPPKDGEFVLVKQITYSPPERRELQVGDLVELELGIFLAGSEGEALGRFNYYADVVVYKVGTPGAQPWFRGPCCDSNLIPWAPKLIPDAALAGGRLMTNHEDTSNQPEMSLMQASPNVAGVNIQPFVEGRRLFHTSLLTGAHVERGNPTLFGVQSGKAGPNFQQTACIQCHTNNGKSSPSLRTPLSKMVVLTGQVDAGGKVVPDSRFGGRLSQGTALDGSVNVDGRQAVLTVDAYNETAGRYPDGSPYALQTPVYKLTDKAGNPLPLPERMSVRAAPHMVGMGLLGAVTGATINGLAVASRSDPDGAVGKVHVVQDLRDPSVNRIGRFGWRATTATVQQQTALALNADMGVTTSVLPKHLCGLASSGDACRAADARGPELLDQDLGLLVRYMSLLAVPPQRHFPGQQPIGPAAPVILAQGAQATAAQERAEAQTQVRVAAGGQLFNQARCTACHTAQLTTNPKHPLAELRNQTIRPYTDLLLHDMGPELADNFPQGNATGREWRTAPLWGLGVLRSIDPNTRYLHDGRARTVEEAILWHGGQGSASRDRFKALSADDRQKLIEFVQSL